MAPVLVACFVIEASGCSLLVDPQVGSEDELLDADLGSDAKVVCSPEAFEHVSTDGASRYSIGSDKTWYEAQSECDALGGHLAVISSPQEVEDLQTLMIEVGMIEGTSVPSASVGAGDHYQEGVFVWIVDGPEQPPGTPPIGWANNQPDGDDAADCVMLLRDRDPTGVLADSQCFVDRFFICECDGTQADGGRHCVTGTDDSCQECNTPCGSTTACDQNTGRCVPPPPE